MQVDNTVYFQIKSPKYKCKRIRNDKNKQLNKSINKHQVLMCNITNINRSIE